MSRQQSERAIGIPVWRLIDIFLAWVLLVFLSICAIVLYVGQFEESNAYIGIVHIWQLGEFWYWLVMGAWLGVMALLFPMHVRSPSDIFLCLYLLGAALWSASYWPATGLLDQAQAVFLACMLLLPALLVATSCGLSQRVFLRVPPLRACFSRSYLVPMLIVLLVVTALLSYWVAGSDAAWSFDDGATRRLAGRDSFGANIVAAYLLQMSVNGIAPFLAYHGMERRSVWALAFAFGFAIFSFWLLALKLPILNVIVLASLGYLVRSGGIVNFSRWLTMSLAAVLSFSVVELWLFGFSLIADYGVRRVVLVSSTIQAYFCDLLLHLDTWQILLNGVELDHFVSPEYLVGAIYMDNPLTNANTNAYLHQAALSGLWGYVLVAGGVALFMIFLDLMHARWGIKDGFAISAIMGTLLVEQAFTTVLVSSGLLLCLLLSLVFSQSPPLHHR
jgi:hypothetical protein